MPAGTVMRTSGVVVLSGPCSGMWAKPMFPCHTLWYPCITLPSTCTCHVTIHCVQQAMLDWWASMWPFLPPALVPELSLNPSSSSFLSSGSAPVADAQQSSHPLQAISTLQAAQMALLPPSSPLHLAEWEQGLLGLPEEQQGCFHAGCLQSLPPHAAAALAEACAYTGSKGSVEPATAPDPTGLGKPLQLCSGCKLVRYCGRECQMAAWRAVHRHTCKLYAAAQKHEEVVSMRRALQAGTEDVAGGGQ
jgi:hypothetical protein